MCGLTALKAFVLATNAASTRLSAPFAGIERTTNTQSTIVDFVVVVSAVVATAAATTIVVVVAISRSDSVSVVAADGVHKHVVV